MTGLPETPGEGQVTLAPEDTPGDAVQPTGQQAAAPVPVPASGSAAASSPAGLIAPTRRGHSGRFITDVLVELGYVTSEQVEGAISESRAAGCSPEELLLQTGVITADQLSRSVAERYGLDYVDLGVFQVDMSAVNLVSVSAARRTRALPVGYLDKETLLLAIADPANVLAVDDIQMSTGFSCRVAVAAPGRHRRAHRPPRHPFLGCRRGGGRSGGGGRRTD